jgi:hypothetical protein
MESNVLRYLYQVLDSAMSVDEFWQNDELIDKFGKWFVDTFLKSKNKKQK